MIHCGYFGEKDPSLLDVPTDNKELKIVNQVLRQTLAEDPEFWSKVVAGCR
jgi:adenosylhomocysteinase